jgi:hypothetical protein
VPTLFHEVSAVPDELVAIGKAAGVGGNVYSAAGKYVSGEADKTAAAPVVAPVGGGKKK